MSGPLIYQEKIPLRNGEHCQIGNYIGEGGLGYIYAIDKKRVIKWYKKEHDIQLMKNNIEKLTQETAPYPNLTWPLMMTWDYKGSFGYVMAKIPNGYVPLSNYIYEDDYYLNVEEMLQIGYAIASSFHAIHQNQYVYQDINPNGIFIHKRLQRVIICDLDNCNKEHKTFVTGTPMYMAPEIVMGMSEPNIYSDYYSLSVILFQLFYINHPLEGRKTWSKPMDKDDEMEYFGRHPLFVCDPVDKTNGFYQDYTEAVQKRWKIFPSALTEAFMTAFTIGLKNPQKRLTDQDWMKVIQQSYDCFVKKDMKGCIKEGFFPITTDLYHKINIQGHQILLSEYKKIYGYLFDDKEIFTTILFECCENLYVTIQSHELYINDQLLQKGEKRLLRPHDVIRYHGIIGIVE